MLWNYSAFNPTGDFWVFQIMTRADDGFGNLIANEGMGASSAMYFILSGKEQP